MATVASKNCARVSPHLLTRTWSLTPAHFHYHFIPNPRNSIKRGLTSYKLSYSAPRMSIRTHARREFHSTRHAAQHARSAIPHISLHIAAASSAKGSKYNAEKTTFDYLPDGSNALGVQTAGNVYQKRRSRPDSGEDAYFVASVGGDTTTIALGVCDGVGGWSEQGINPADFSHGMCSYMAATALGWNQSSSQETLHPQALMHSGYDDTLKDVSIRAGGATACVAIADGTGRMRTANLGDSGFIQVRSGSVHQYSDPQTHAFNTPYQLSKTPPEILTQAAIFGGLPLNDSPDRADVADLQLQHGDVVVFATDGVWDNLSSQDILTIVSKQMRESCAWEMTSDRRIVVTTNLAPLLQTTATDSQPRKSLQSVIASHIAGEAKLASSDRNRDGPFAKAVQREYPLDRWHGGKVDDITVLVLIAVENKQQDDDQLKAKL